MAVWTRQQNGLFASGSRFVWEFLRDEVAAWRTSLNALVDGQFAAGQSFSNGFLGHAANVSEARWSFYGVPIGSESPAGGESAVRVLLPIGAMRCPRRVEIRRVTVSAAPSDGTSQLVQTTFDAADWRFDIRQVHRERARTLFGVRASWTTIPNIRPAGDLFNTARSGTIVSANVRLTRVATPPDITDDAHDIPMTRAIFEAGDVLVGVLDVNTSTPVTRTARFISVRIEYAQVHED